MPSEPLTLVIFSIFRTDLRRSSISRRVAMLRAPAGAAPSAVGWAARRSVLRASMAVDSRRRVVKLEEDECNVGRDRQRASAEPPCENDLAELELPARSI